MTADPLIDAALDLLRQFRLDDRYEAAKVLRLWVHFDELTYTQLRQVLKQYPSRGAPPVPPTEGANGT